jgi:hypothetical protein
MGVLAAATCMISASGVIMTISDLDIRDLARGINESMWPLAIALLIALGQFFFYYLFRLILHIISSRAMPKTESTD